MKTCTLSKNTSPKLLRLIANEVERRTHILKFKKETPEAYIELVMRDGVFTKAKLQAAQDYVLKEWL